jgi:hypothetical protein
MAAQSEGEQERVRGRPTNGCPAPISGAVL